MSTTHADTHTHAHDAHGHEAHPAHLAHHFDTPEQQFSTGKLGMWTFLATEILMFGGLFCAYAIYRYNNPEVFLMAHKALDTNLGAINTAVLLASSFTMAWGVRAAQLNQRGLLLIMLALTFVGGIGFMAIKSVEYHSKWKHQLFPGKLNVFNAGFTPEEGQGDVNALRAETIQYIEKHGKAPHGGSHGDEHADSVDAGHSTDKHASDPHAPDGQAANEFGTSAHAGGAQEHATDGNVTNSGHDTSPTQVVTAVTTVGTPVYDPNAGQANEAKITAAMPRTIPGGLNLDAVDGLDHGHRVVTYNQLQTLDQKRVNTFFSVYFLMTGLHAIHVIIGMGIIAWLFVKALGGAFSSSYYTPVDLGGLYWHLVDLIWIFLFPLLYLIH